MPKLRLLLLTFLLFLWFPLGASAQSASLDQRAAQWNGYALPAGNFVRFVEKQKGYSLWRPAEWKESADFGGVISFSAGQDGPSVRIFTGEVPDGYGTANFASAILQQWRKQPIKQETMTARRVLVGGLEGREFNFEIETEPGHVVRETVWLTAVGPRAYVFYFMTEPHEQEKYEPYFKRMMLSVRIGAAGHWDEEFETLRTRFSSGAIAGREVEAALLGEAVRAGRETGEKLAGRLAELVTRVPDAALDLLTDYDPQVRAAAIEAFGRVPDERATEALVWALTDRDAYASATAARMLAARGPAGVAALRRKLSTLTKDPGVILRAGAALTDEAARDLASELIKSDQSKDQLAGLQLAMALPLKGLVLPYQKLLASGETEVVAATVEAIRQRRATDAMPELLKLLSGDKEMWAVRALGEIAPADFGRRFTERIKEIDARLAAIVNSRMQQGSPQRQRNRVGATRSSRRARNSGPKVLVQATTLPPPQPQAKESPSSQEAEYLLTEDLASPLSLPIKTYQSLPEETRLAMLRGELVDASQKIDYRHRWANAVDAAARRAIYEEALGKYRLSEWAKVALQPASASPAAMPLTIDTSRLADAPTTGESLFPQSSTLYLMAPNFEQTLAKLDAAFSGIQMEGVRDQMTFALILKAFKTRLASKLNAEATPDASATLGIDLKSPLALAAWPAEDGPGSAVTESAMVLRVSDRARFERMLALYQNGLGDFDSFAAVASGVVRFAGIAPALFPLGMVGLAAQNPFGGARFKQERPLNTAVYFRQESIGNLPITVIEKLITYKTDAAERETIYVAYLGSTAIIAPTRTSLIDLLKTNPERATIKRSEAFARARAEAGEIVFFSQPGELFKSLLANTNQLKEPGDKIASGLVKALGAEYGSLRLSPSSWETVFHLNLSDGELVRAVKPFKADELSVPRELLPASTILYAGAVFDSTKLWSGLKSAGLFSEQNSLGSGEAEKTVAPKLHGEIGVALVSIAPTLDPSQRGLPSMLLALKLKDQELAAQHRSGKLFAKASSVPGATVFGAPVVTIPDGRDKLYVAVTDRYLLIAESVGTLKRLEAKDKFATTRDWTRSVAASPESLALFATYNLDAAFEDVHSAMAKDESAQIIFTTISALIHAFHSQRAVISINGNTLEGRLAVAFDRQGRFSVGEVAREAREFDVANAVITPKGLDIVQPKRTESLRLRVTARQPGLIARLRDDVAGFAGQRVETSNDSSLILSVNARRIPEKQTVQLPVSGAEFAPYLRPTPRINSTAPQIISLAKEIAGKDRDALSVAHKLGEWTYNNLKWKRVESGTLETLASREADCLEHSELYVALARALGLPARVVIGAAFGDGAFTAHAWVEIYLGRWVEVDPTWGMMDYVDSTHLRFEGQSFITYAMLNQIQLEVLEARSFVADYQRDPIQLVKALGATDVKESHEFVWDFALAAEQALGAELLRQLDDKQRAAIIQAFDRAVSQELENWELQWMGASRILSSEVKENRATILALRGDDLLRISLAARDGAWYITDIEDLDYGVPVIKDALRAAPQEVVSRLQVLSFSSERALKQVDQWIAAEGESERLLFLKALVLRNKQFAESLEAAREDRKEKSQPAPGAAAALLKQITTRWPDFAPAHYALGVQLLSYDEEPEKAIAPLQRYAQLMPLDPRPWANLGEAFEKLKRYGEAEAAYREAAARDRDNFERQLALAAFYFKQHQPLKAKESLAQTLRLAPDADAAFYSLTCEALDIAAEGDKEGHRRLEELLLSFPKEVGGSKGGLRRLAHAQSEQGKDDAAMQTIGRVVALGPEASDYIWIAQMSRAARRFPAALNAADQALKLDKENADAFFERACALAQLGSKKEALAALKKAIELDPDLRDRLEETDLKPLASMLEFAALLKERAEQKDEAEESQPGKKASSSP